jgi:acyl CoA:acetate/3-ketoacid CoA transferase beta subunit
LEVDRPGQDGLTLVHLAPGVTVDELPSKTEATLKVREGLKAA